ncbi:plasmid replication protein, CyRepA1 family [Methylovulum psychrotolerans]|uniref:Uncharacterized protein n=1 Tax=Methylovulum psychrotolerans TaxID=1704499 RepID=A0A1Z4C3F3_9GAMM|nr:plasmid replication protein, CyRepA1 family [Methylovulum psychrotolerans]ASF48077.1 hypothetical protein CEK71_19485 [Methylovulum psychrotolerans]
MFTNKPQQSIWDIINAYHGEICGFMANFGIDGNKALPLAEIGRKINSNIIAADNDHRGKVFFVLHKYTAPDGREYPIIFCYTNKHGGDSDTWNGYEAVHGELSHAPDFAPYKYTPPKKQAKPKENWRTKAFAEAGDAFINAASAGVGGFAYIAAKGVNTDGIDIRRGIGKHGDCIMVAYRNHDGGIVCYQQIYAENVPGKNTDKLYFVANEGDKKGAFAVIGDASKIKDGAYFCEGLATGLSSYHADGMGDNMLNNADKMPVIVCMDAGNLPLVVESFANRCDDIKILADNDLNADGGNVGIYKALEAAHTVGAKSLYVPCMAGDPQKCDFNDTLGFYTLVVPVNRSKRTLQLIEYAPKNRLKRLYTRLSFDVAAECPYRFDVATAANFVMDAMQGRGFDPVQLNVYRIIVGSVKKREDAAKKRNKITEKLGLTLHDLHGLGNDNASIARHVLESGGGIWLDNRGLGSGKTELMGAICAQLEGQRIAYVTHRVSLVHDAAGRLELTSYHDTLPGFSQNIALCVNSAEKFGLPTFTILLLDEFRQILNHVINGSVQNRQACFNTLVQAIEQADFVLCSDADLNNESVDFLRRHTQGKPLNLIKADSRKNDKTLHILSGHNANFKAILAEINAGGRPCVACTSKKMAEKLHRYLAENGIPADDVLLIHSQNKDDVKQSAFLKNANAEAGNYRALIYSPTIGSGVSMNTGHFTSNYLLNSGNLPSNEALQMVARNRTATDIFISFSPQRARDRVTDLDLLVEGDKKKKAHYLQPDGHNGYKPTELGNLRIAYHAAVNEDLNDFANNFIFLAEMGGYAIDRAEINNKPDTAEFSGLATRTHEARCAAIYHAQPIDQTEAKQIENGLALATQENSDKLDRYRTTAMAGTDKIGFDDVVNYDGGAAKQLANFETVNGDINEAVKADITNEITQDKATSKASLHKIFTEIIRPLSENDTVIDKETAAAACEQLKANAAELAANGFSDYRRKAFIRPVPILGAFLDKFGYKLLEISRTKKGVRTYQIVPIEHIRRYADNRLKRERCQ